MRFDIILLNNICMYDAAANSGNVNYKALIEFEPTPYRYCPSNVIRDSIYLRKAGDDWWRHLANANAARL